MVLALTSSELESVMAEARIGPIARRKMRKVIERRTAPTAVTKASESRTRGHGAPHADNTPTPSF